ncbi:MAG: zinc metallopeptidase [Lachnospiraceae bacterium]|nr:zinc metallopeptidase [Lachnospiraceae bacterium]
MYYGYGYGMGMFMDPTYILVLIGAILSIVASARVNSTFNKYARVRSMTGMTGAEAAQRLLHHAGITDVRVEHIRGNLTDHYDPRAKVLRLSDATYGSASVAAVGVAAHECGHAIQHQEGYLPLQIRSALVPVANFGSKLGIPIILLGILFGYNYTLVQIGIWVFALAVGFQVITLPVEFNASSRAVRLLDQQGILAGQEVKDCRKVLGAAALTYVAAAAASILQLLRLVLIFGGGRNDRRD